MGVLDNAIQNARSVCDTASEPSIGVLVQNPAEFGSSQNVLSDPLDGIGAVQKAVQLLGARCLEDFALCLAQEKVSPNIVLAEGTPLLLQCLKEFPKDVARLETLLSCGADPNFFMAAGHGIAREHDNYRLGLHPLNYAFAHCPQEIPFESCVVLRKYGASADGLRYHFEVAPGKAVEDTPEKAALRQELIRQDPDPACCALLRKEVDLSLMADSLSNLEKQFKTAGYTITCAPRVQKATLTEQPESVPEEQYFIGQLVLNKGIYLSRWSPVGHDGAKIGKTFDVFVAPEDITDKKGHKFAGTYPEVLTEVRRLRSWHGHAGLYVHDEADLIRHLTVDTHKGRWFIPPREILCGLDRDGQEIHKLNMMAFQNVGAFEGTYCSPIQQASGSSSWYWSSTNIEDGANILYTVHFADKQHDTDAETESIMSCRLIRVEECKP